MDGQTSLDPRLTDDRPIVYWEVGYFLSIGHCNVRRTKITCYLCTYFHDARTNAPVQVHHFLTKLFF